VRYFLTAIIILLATSAFAEMYIWTDEKGIKHLSNFAPPPTAKDVKVGDEITKTESQRNAEIEYNRKRRERTYAIPEKKHTKKRSYSSNLPINATRAAKQKSTYTSTSSDSDSAYIEGLKKKIDQWYPGKDKNTSGWSAERKNQALRDPRRVEAEKARRELDKHNLYKKRAAMYGPARAREMELEDRIKKLENRRWENYRR